jgi:hypothetical protein
MIIIIYFVSVFALLEATLRLTPGCNEGSPSPFDIYECDTCVHFLCFVKTFIFDFVYISA